MKGVGRLLAVGILILVLLLFYEQKRCKINFKSYVVAADPRKDELLEKKCLYKAFGDSVLVLNFNFAMYRNVEMMYQLYDGVFAKIVICGPRPKFGGLKPDVVAELGKGDFSYHCMGLAMEKYPGYKGYFYGNDDMVINWWNFIDLDRSKIWHGTQVVDFTQLAFGDTLNNNWIWWKTFMGITACRQYHDKLRSIALTERNFTNYATYMRNGGGQARCGKGWSDFYYVPGRYATEFSRLSHIAFKAKLYLEIATHNILRSLTDSDQFVVLKGVYMPDLGHANYTARAFWKVYNRQIPFIHPFKFHDKDSLESLQILKSKVIEFKQKLVDCKL